MHQEWLRQVVDRDDLTRHDKWLCMMLPRLRLLHELLREDGVIFISIDDNEVQHLRMLMDEIFGEENFVAGFVWQRRVSPDSDEAFVTNTHDYILSFAKNKTITKFNRLVRTEEANARYSNPDNDSRGPWTSSDLTRREYREHDYYAITLPSGREVWPASGRSWSVPRESYQKLVAENRVWFGPDGDAMPRRKRFIAEVREGLVPTTWWSKDVADDNASAKQNLRELFPEIQDIFATPKPVKLIKKLLELATNPAGGDIVLDSFAGSGTTGQAVLALNAEDGGNRRFILIEQEEYARSLTAERLRRVIAGVPAAKDETLRNGLGGSFSFYSLSQPLDELGLLTGETMPSYREMARYVFFNATGHHLDEAQVDEERGYLGSTAKYDVYLIYQPSVEYLKTHPLTLEWAKQLPEAAGKTRLVCASHKYVDSEWLLTLRMEFFQLPFALTRFRG